MATRTFCDHCGNTVHNPNKFQFGPRQARDVAQEDLARAYQQIKGASIFGGGGAGGASTGVAVPADPLKPSLSVRYLDLCDTCVPIWMRRVDNLCKVSDEDV